jgi:hypothetical protein
MTVAGALAMKLLSSSAHANNGKHLGWYKNSACLLRGTRVLTPTGERRVEDLRIGDQVITARGEAVPVRWIGRRAYTKTGPTWQASVMPIRIARSALDERTPQADLYVSPEHALLVDGFLVSARDLVNGLSIAPGLPPGRTGVEYFHILLDTHEIILTEGAPSATLLIRTGREHEAFANFAEYEHLFPAGKSPRMAPAAPIYSGGWTHLAALLRLGVSTLVDVRHPVERAYDRIADRARELVA